MQIRQPVPLCAPRWWEVKLDLNVKISSKDKLMINWGGRSGMSRATADPLHTLTAPRVVLVGDVHTHIPPTHTLPLSTTHHQKEMRCFNILPFISPVLRHATLTPPQSHSWRGELSQNWKHTHAHRFHRKWRWEEVWVGERQYSSLIRGVSRGPV